MPIDLPLSGMPSPTLYGTGAPSVLYNADAAMAGLLYLQTDAVPGQRLWICIGTSGSYQWEQVRGFVSSTVTPAITATLGITVATNTYTGSVNNSSAVVGMTCRMEPIGADPGNVLLWAGVQTNGVINHRITNLATVNTALSGISFGLYLSHP